MIVGDGWLIVNAPRTGTVSWRDWARTCADATYVKPRHLVRVPDGLEHHERILTVRDPYERLASIWRYHQRKRHEQWHPGVDTRGMEFGAFVAYLAERRVQTLARPWPRYVCDPPWTWVMTCAEYADRLGGDVRVFRLEEMESNLGWLRERYGIGRCRRISRANSTPSEIVEWTPDVLRVVNEQWAAADCERFGYRLREGT